MARYVAICLQGFQTKSRLATVTAEYPVKVVHEISHSLYKVLL